MAEVRKKEKVKKYNIDELSVEAKQKKEKVVEKNIKKPNNSKKKNGNKKEEKKSLFVRFRIFCHGVKSEFSKVHWPGRKDMIKYSVATILFVIFCSLFFYLIDVIFALIQSIFK